MVLLILHPRGEVHTEFIRVGSCAGDWGVRVLQSLVLTQGMAKVDDRRISLSLLLRTPEVLIMAPPISQDSSMFPPLLSLPFVFPILQLLLLF